MGYMHDIEVWLVVLLQELGDGKFSEAEAARAIRQKILESYRNGQAAGPRKASGGKGRTNKPTQPNHGR